MAGQNTGSFNKLVYCLFGLALILIVVGAVMVFLVPPSTIQLEIRGQNFTSDSVGLTSMFFGVLLILGNFKHLIALATKSHEKQRSEGLLTIDDVRVTQNKEAMICTLDFIVSNKGNSQVVISAVELEVEDTARAEMLKARFLPTGSYDVDISELDSKGQRATCNVSQEVSPGRSDRFQVNLSASNLGSGTFGVWLLNLKCMTNFGDVTWQEPVECWLPFQEGSSLDEMKIFQSLEKGPKNLLP